MSSTSSLLDGNGIDGLVDELLGKYLKINGNSNNDEKNKGVMLNNNNSEDLEKGGGCCGGKKVKKKNKNKTGIKSEIAEDNEKYNEEDF